MASNKLPPPPLVNPKRKNFLGQPSPLGYVAGVGRGYVHFILFTQFELKLIKILVFAVLLVSLHVLILVLPEMPMMSQTTVTQRQTSERKMKKKKIMKT
jgi:hypothetical protein